MADVVLVDRSDRETGTCEKIEAHRKGLLHRAFSVFVFNSGNELILQKRAAGKYHSEGKWSNTCCSHPLPGEPAIEAAKRRLKEEMGIECELSFAFSFIYRAELSNGMTEHELDHVFIGFSDEMPSPNPEEVQEWKLMPLEELQRDIDANPERYSYWLKKALPGVKKWLSQRHTKRKS